MKPEINQAAMSDTNRRSDTLVKYNIRGVKSYRERLLKVDKALYM